MFTGHLAIIISIVVRGFCVAWKKIISEKVVVFFNCKEIVKSGAISGWTEEDQLQIWSSHSLSTNNDLHYVFYKLIMEMLTYHIFTACHSRQDNVATWLVAYRNKKNISIIDISTFWHHILCYLSRYISKFTGWAIIEELSESACWTLVC